MRTEYRSDSHTVSLVGAILADHFPGDPAADIRFLGGGAVNAVYCASAGSRAVAVRLADARYRAGESQKEAWCLEKAAAAGVPGPAVLAIGERDGAVYMVQELLVGSGGDEAGIDRRLAWRDLGRYARKIHGIDIESSFDVETQGELRARKRWEDFVAYGLASLTPEDELIERAVYAWEEQSAVRAVFEKIGQRPFNFGLVHGDLSLRNVIVQDDGRMTLFDWGCAAIDIIPHTEIAAILRWLAPEDDCFSAFLEGYGMSREEFEEMTPALDEYRLLKSFDLVRWAIDRRPEQIEDYAARAREEWRRFKNIDPPQAE